MKSIFNWVLKSGLHFVWFISLCDWSRKFRAIILISQVRNSNQSAFRLLHFPALHRVCLVLTLSSNWLLLVFFLRSHWLFLVFLLFLLAPFGTSLCSHWLLLIFSCYSHWPLLVFSFFLTGSFCYFPLFSLAPLGIFRFPQWFVLVFFFVPIGSFRYFSLFSLAVVIGFDFAILNRKALNKLSCICSWGILLLLLKTSVEM